MRHSAAISALDEGVALAVAQERPGDSGTREMRGYTYVSHRPRRGHCGVGGRAVPELAQCATYAGLRGRGLM